MTPPLFCYQIRHFRGHAELLESGLYRAFHCYRFRYIFLLKILSSPKSSAPINAKNSYNAKHDISILLLHYCLPKFSPRCTMPLSIIMITIHYYYTKVINVSHLLSPHLRHRHPSNGFRFAAIASGFTPRARRAHSATRDLVTCSASRKSISTGHDKAGHANTHASIC